MTMHPELEHVFSSGVPMRQVIETFRKYHGGPINRELHYLTYPDNPKDPEFWDQWSPLWRSLSDNVWLPPLVNQISEPSLNIHRALIRNVISWLCDSERKSSICFITEREFPSRMSLGIRAAALANICYGAQRLGLFGHYKATISEISVALAALYPPYRRNLTWTLIENPGINKLPTRVQFKKLIHEPWRALETTHSQYVTTPPVIILRLEYEWEDQDLLRSICEFGSRCSSLLWIISIDPQLKYFMDPILNLVDRLAPFPYIRPPVCYSEASADASLVLHHEFSTLRIKYTDILDEEVWPSEEQMSQLVRIVSGTFEFVNVIIIFIDWEHDGGPRTHLETLLGYMVDSPSPSDEQPYCALDHFYIRALSDIPPDLLVVVKKTFGVISCSNILTLSLPQLVCMFSLGSDTFFPYLKRLAVETYDWEFQRPHSHFREFLQDPSRSGQFYTPASESLHHTARAYLYVVAHCSNLTTIMKSQAIQYFQIDQLTCSDEILGKLREHAGNELRSLAGRMIYGPGSDWKSLLRFDFRWLAHTHDRVLPENFIKFLKYLYTLYKVDPVNIVRVQPASPLDKQFIEKCEGLAEPMALEEEADEDKLSFSVPKYVLLGCEAETVLVVLAEYLQEATLSWWEEFININIYTSAMLDYM